MVRSFVVMAIAMAVMAKAETWDIVNLAGNRTSLKGPKYLSFGVGI